MANFYKGNNLLANKNLEAYLNGYEYIKVGQYTKKVPLKGGTTKYNYNFIMETKQLIYDYSCLLRLDFCIKSILSKFDGSDGDISNIWRLIKAQSGTVRFLRLLCDSLKKYKVCTQTVYNTIKADLRITRERYDRNLSLLHNLLKDYGLDEFVDFIERKTGKTIFDNIFDFYNSHNVDVTEIIDDKEKCNLLDNMYIEYMYQIGKENNLDLEKGISERLQISREVRKIAKENLDKEKLRYKLAKRNSKGKELVALNNASLNEAIRNISNNDFSAKTIYNLVTKLKVIGNHGYYVAIVKGNTVYYIKDNKGTTTSIAMALLFADKLEAENFKNTLDEYKDKYYLEVGEAILSLEKKEAQLSMLGSISSNMDNFNNQFNAAINRRPQELCLGRQQVDSILLRLSNKPEENCYVLNKQLNFLCNINNSVEYMKKYTKIALYTKEKAEYIANQYDGKVYEIIFDKEFREETLDNVFMDFDTKIFDDNFIKVHLIEENIEIGYYLVGYDRTINKILYYTKNNKFELNKNLIKIFTKKPNVQNMNNNLCIRCYSVSMTNDLYNDINKKYDLAANIVLETSLVPVYNKYVILSNNSNLEKDYLSYICLTNNNKFGAIPNRNVKLFDTVEDAENYWSELIRINSSYEGRTHKVVEVNRTEEEVLLYNNKKRMSKIKNIIFT